jgi:glycerol kinase
MSYFLGIDQGSHSSRAVLFDNNGELVMQAAEPIVPERPCPDCIEYEAGALLNSIETVVKRVLGFVDAEDREHIAACGIATQRSTVLAWDVNGNALSPALSWQDVRAKSLVQRLSPNEQEVRRLTGLPLTPFYSASKMHWLLHHSERVRQCEHGNLRLSPLVSYLLFHLLGNKPYVIDYSNAQRTQLFDVNTLTWSRRLCDWFEIDISKLPLCKPMCANYGTLAETAIPVTAVCGDQNAAMFGIGALEEGVALINIGSGAFVLRELAGYTDSATQITGIAMADHLRVSFMREATINGAGNALSWAEQRWGVDRLADTLPEWMQAVTEPPVFINAVGGLGTPWMRSDIDSSFVGRGDCTIADKVVAIIESVVFMIQANLEIMGAEAPLKKIRVSGGLSNLDGLCQKLSDLSGLDVVRSDVAEASARGAAWLAAGRPENWNTTADIRLVRFSPQPAQRLKFRYRVFKSELERILGANQSTRGIQ